MAAIQETFCHSDHEAVCVVDGYGAHLKLRGGELVVTDGLGAERRERRYPAIGSRIRRLVILGHASLTTDALRWCEEQGVKIAVLGANQDVLVCSGTGPDDARLRRSQAAAPNQPVGLEIAKVLLGAKLKGQATVAGQVLHQPVVSDTIDALAAALEVADTIEECRDLEAMGAEAYFSGWVDNPATALRFASAELSRGRIPGHWQRYDGRRSLLGSANSNHKAERPLTPC